MRKPALFLVAAVALGLSAAGLGQAGSSAPALTGACAKANLKLVKGGQLSLATDNLSFPPWFGGKERKGSGFAPSDPYSGQGYESAVAYEVAKRLGFARGEVMWIAVPFGKSFAPGKKAFDWYISQVSYKPVRAKAADFSKSYYFVNQAVVGLKGKPITKVKTVAGLGPFQLGVAIGTTSYDYIVDHIKSKPKVYDTNADAVAALKNGRIDGLVVDFPSTGYITGVQVPNSTVVGRLPTKGTRERFGMIFQKGNPLVSCVNKVLDRMWADGTLKRLEARWLAGSAPILK